jgi:diguanylate cyclase (GGDEF)-like protein/putative nucleotidyltransferase with HDIG domain
VETINLSGTTPQNRAEVMSEPGRASLEEIGTAVLLTAAPLTRMISVVLGALDRPVAGRDFHDTPLDTPAFSGDFSAILGTSFGMTIGGAVLGEVQTSAIVLLAGAALLAGFFSYVYEQKRQQYLLAWALAWLLVGCYFIRPALGFSFDSIPWFAFDEWILSVAMLAFYCSARLYARLKIPVAGVSLAAAIAAVWSVAYVAGWVPVHLGLGVALGFFVVARTFWQEGSTEESRADQLLAFAFVCSGLLRLLIIFQSRLGSLKNAHLIAFALLPEMFGGVLMLMAVYEEERRRIERNMLALSNLNLATSSFSGGEIQKMLAQALDRVLNVARIPSGVLALHYGDGNGPASIVATGVSDSFSAEIQKDRLNDFTVTLVARMGGLVVLRDLARDANWVALEKEESFRRVRQLLLGQGMRTVVGISLQAKERVFGVLLLGTPDNRNFTPAELRLLLALGHQIGMAVENSYLVQQTSRRSEELHLLNEIGRALSSTLEPDALFERIYAEMRRLFDVSSLFIAFQDQKPKQIRFEIEVVDGVRLPKRVRPAGNHMAEYVVSSGQPLLIRDKFSEETNRIGFEPQRQAGSVCAVPLILYDRAIGVMAVHSMQERAFDEGHVELLRVLASEAAVAIENARLFSQEQNKSRQLTLINNISSHAITTLDPQEMLSKIVAEIEKAVPYDHIGIAILDYSSKELMIQAEAGTRRDALGRHVTLGEGLIGQAARTGQMVVVPEVNANSPRPILAGTLSAIALPVSYGEQMLGVLYVESSEKCEFPEDEVRLLRTLADLFAGALHNALTFQKAQEQAITDGLTGVKTHRFLMEALSSEWKRSTRANRPFALVLMDLDRFKFVNDFYGHLEGDVVLQRVGHILEQNCRRSDVVARYGGDEFVILMPETTVDSARQLAGKLRGWVAADPLLRDKNITASFGIAGFPIHGSTPQELIQVADSSMYLSKHQGGNSVSSVEQGDPNDTKRWKKDVLEAYLGVTLKRLFSTGPEAFEEIYRRLEQFTRSLTEQGVCGPGHEIPSAVVDTVTSLALAIDAKDHYTQGHSQKVSAYAVMIAQALNIGQAEVEEIRLAGLLHDIGKVGIPEVILNKSGPLDSEEWETMKTHTLLGAKILEPLEAMGRIRLMVRHHHEFYDGTGYPDRLVGDRIPFGARVIAIADAYDTITSERTYKKPRRPEEAFAELQRCSSTQFDPEIIRVFITTMRRAPQSFVEAPVGALGNQETSSL